VGLVARRRCLLLGCDASTYLEPNRQPNAHANAPADNKDPYGTPHGKSFGATFPHANQDARFRGLLPLRELEKGLQDACELHVEQGGKGMFARWRRRVCLCGQKVQMHQDGWVRVEQVDRLLRYVEISMRGRSHRQAEKEDEGNMVRRRRKCLRLRDVLWWNLHLQAQRFVDFLDKEEPVFLLQKEPGQEGNRVHGRTVRYRLGPAVIWTRNHRCENALIQSLYTLPTSYKHIGGMRGGFRM